MLLAALSGKGNSDQMTSQPRNVAIFIYNKVEVLDFCGPFEVFGVTTAAHGVPAFKVFTVAERAEPIAANTGLKIIPDYSFADCLPLDILLIPGGDGRNLVKNQPLLDWVRARAEQTEYLLSVCTGALVYAKLGLLDGLDSTTHYSALELLQQIAPQTTVRSGARYVDNGRIITSAGISAGIDMALHVVAKLVGEEAAAQTARYMEYDYWTPRAANAVIK
jgi:transcriptional regulator GlxA family with amidase domain